MKVTEAELYQIIGELYVARALTDQTCKQMLIQAEEMSKVITGLRQVVMELEDKVNGKLVKPDDNN